MKGTEGLTRTFTSANCLRADDAAAIPDPDQPDQA